MEDLTGKTALVSGGSRGIGYATAAALVARGARVVISARGGPRLEEARRRLTELGGEVATVCGDVGVWEDAEAMVEAAVARFGRLDILVNNAGISMSGRFAELAPEVCAEVVGTNLLGSIFLSRAAVEHLCAARGHLVFVSSVAGLFGLPNASVYCAAKRALDGLAESLRIELARDGVHVGVAHLGFVEHDPEKHILAADGEHLPPERPAHASQAATAARIVRMLDRRRDQIVTTPVGVASWLAHRLAPGAVAATLRWAAHGRPRIFDRFAYEG